MENGRPLFFSPICFLPPSLFCLPPGRSPAALSVSLSLPSFFLLSIFFYGSGPWQSSRPSTHSACTFLPQSFVLEEVFPDRLGLFQRAYFFGDKALISPTAGISCYQEDPWLPSYFPREGFLQDLRRSLPRLCRQRHLSPLRFSLPIFHSVCLLESV